MSSFLANRMRRLKESLWQSSELRPRRNGQSSRARNLRLESLEQRQLLDAGGLDFGEPGILSTNGGAFGNNLFVDLATDGEGNSVAVWYSTDTVGGTLGTDTDIFVSRSADAGDTWSDPVPLNANAATDSGDDTMPKVAADGAGNWVAVWHSDDSLGGTIGTDHDILMSRSTDDGVSWTAPMALNANAAADSGADDNPELTSDGAGNWVAVWSSDDTLGGTAGSDRDILVSRSTNNGANWTSPSALNSNAASDSHYDEFPQISTDSTGNWVAVWNSPDSLGGTIGYDKDIFVSRSADAGATWTALEVLNTNASTDSQVDYYPEIANDGANWIAVWSSAEDLDGSAGTDYDVFVSRSVDAGATWSAPETLNTNAGVDSGTDNFPQITTDGAGNWVAVWYSNDSLDATIGTDNDALLSQSVDAGVTWTAPVPLNTYAASDSSFDASPQVATDGAGNWVAAWTSNDSLGGTNDTNWDIFFTPFSLDASVEPPAPGELDPAFGDGGIVTTDFGGTDDYGLDATGQPDGKTIVVGKTNSTGLMLRYESNGDLDGTFGQQGKVLLDFGGTRFFSECVTVQSDGKIVVAGFADQSPNQNDFAVARFHEDGSPDTGFGTGGRVAIDFGGTNDQAYDVTIQQVDGVEKIVAAGFSTQGATSRDFAVARLNADGTLDTSFGADGKATTSFDSGAYSDVAWGVAAETDGRIVLAGEANLSSGGMQFAVACYNLDGTPNMAFDGDGKLTTAFGTGTRVESGQDVAFQGNKIVVAGYSNQAGLTNRDYAVARYDLNGTLDTSFGGDGKVTTHMGYSYAWDFGYSMAVSADKIVVAGRAYQGPTNYDFGIVCYDYDGSLNSSFGTDGIVTTDMGYNGYDRAEAVVLHGDRMVVVGYTNTGTTSRNDIALAAYESGLGPGTIAGTRFEDVNGNGLQDAGEPGIEGVVYLDMNGNGTLDAHTTLDPDDYSDGDVLNAISPGVTLMAVNADGVPVLGGPVVASADALASTGANAFGHSLGSTWNEAVAQLRIDFTEPVSIVSLDVTADTAGAIGQIELYDADDQLLDIVLTSSLSSGSVQILRVVRPLEDIAYAVAGSAAGSVHLDNLAFGAAEIWVAANADGEYLLEDVPAGSHVVRQEITLGWEQTNLVADAFYYAIDRYGAELLKIDAATGDITIVGPHGAGKRLHGLVQTNSGELFAVAGDGTDGFYRIDPATGAATLIGDVGSHVGWGLAYDSANDTIYSYSHGRPAIFDRVTGEVTRFGEYFSIPAVSGIAYDDAGQRVVIYDSVANAFYAYDAEGNVSTLGSTDQFWSHSLAYADGTFVMSRSFYDGDGVNRNKVLLSVDPDTGSITPLLNMSQSRVIETLDYVPEESGAHEINLSHGETISQLDFGSVAVDTRPTALPDQTEITEDDAIAIDVLANDTDADGDALATVAVWGVSELGVPLSINPDGTVSYDPGGLFDAMAPGDIAIDTFRYRVGDSNGNLDAAGVTVTITGVNDAPSLAGIPDVAFDEDSADSSIDLDAYYSDPETLAQDASFEIVSAFSGVSAAIDPLTHVLSITGDSNFNGQGTVVVRVTDTGDGTSPGLSDEHTLLVTVNPINDAPVLTGIPDVAFDEDGLDSSIDLDAYYSDVETLAEDASFEVVSALNGISAEIDPLTHVLTVTGDSNFNGAGSILVRVTDTGDGTAAVLTAEDTLVVTVDPVNDQPVADSQDVTVTEDGAVSITLSAGDVETDEANLTFTLTSIPQGGTLTDADGNEITADESGNIVNGTFLGAPTLTFEPGAAREGARTTSLSFTVTDRGDPDNAPLGDTALTSDLALVTVDVTKAVEDAQVTLDADGVVRIGGTAGNDVILVWSSWCDDSLHVCINGTVESIIPTENVSEIRAWGREGDDAILLLNVPSMAFLHGGGGDDLLRGGCASDLIFGGTGNDFLLGAAGDDMLIGGDGNDRIIGSSGHDILVAGDIDGDCTDEALRALLADWGAGQIADDTEADGLVDDSILDDDFDKLTGSSGADWFIVGEGDRITDWKWRRSRDGDLVTQA
jgi:uncharacterized delta-60 repeat protein